jgi:predicted amidohydrolase YtcJ
MSAVLERARRAPRSRQTDQAADLVLAGGAVATMDATRRVAEAIAIRDGRIVFVGLARDAQRLVGPSTRVVELRGRMVLPGFQDAHCHPTHGGLAMLQCDLHELVGTDVLIDAIRGYADGEPDRPWILGGGWYMADFLDGSPPKEILDSIVPDRPVYLKSRDGHSAWVNSRALELGGIERDTPDPADGRIQRTADGEPQGTLHEGAMALVRRLIPETQPDEMQRGLQKAQAHLHALGITAWQDAIILEEDDDAYAALAGRGELTARVAGARWWDREAGLEQLDEILAWRDRGPVGRYRRTSVKLMLDGVLENFTGALLEAYLDDHEHPTANAGIDFIAREVLLEAVPRMDAAGLQPHFHAIGDRAVRNALDAVEAARRANGRSDTRPHVAHIQVIHPDDLPRFREVGLVANAQPFWACHEPQMDVLTVPFLGPERAGWQYPFASLRRAGAMLAMGSDWPVTTPDPLEEIEVAVERVAGLLRDDEEPFLPSERLTLEDALAAFTIGSAYVNHIDDVTGTLEIGKLADITVLDRDLFAPDAGPIGEASVVLTLVEGEVVHESGLEG